MSVPKLTHLSEQGAAHMVDVSPKEATSRRAVAKSRIRMSPAAANAIRVASGQPDSELGDTLDGAMGTLRKGDCLPVARIAAIQAAKSTPTLIPLCHVVPLESVSVTHRWVDPCELEWTVEVAATWKTGVEMEALTGATAAALTTYDMCKSIDRSMEITHIALWHKSGGRNGDYHRES